MKRKIIKEIAHNEMHGRKIHQKMMGEVAMASNSDDYESLEVLVISAIHSNDE